MNELKKLAAEFFELQNKCDGTPETCARLYPLARKLLERVKNLELRSRSREVRYFAFKLHQDVSDMETRFWKYTLEIKT